jgi:hypothetical protein
MALGQAKGVPVYDAASGVIVASTLLVVGGAIYLMLSQAKSFDGEPSDQIEGLDKLRGSPAAHEARTRARIAKAVTMAQKSLQASACLPRKRTLIRAMRELARADENSEWGGDREQLDMAFDAVMLAMREWQTDCADAA